MVDIPVGKALVAAVSDKDMDCKNCYMSFFDVPACHYFACGSGNRKDGKNVIFRLVDLPGDNKTNES